MRRFRRSALMAAFAITTLVAFPAALAQTPAGNCVRDSFGKVICGKGQCALDQYGKVHCAKEGGGGALRNQLGHVLCGVGYCATDDQGRVKCSSTPGGGAAMDSNGKVQCTGSCQDASPRMCEEGR